MTLVELVYRQTADFPRQEIFGLTAQIRRSAVSIPSNLAEGAARNSSRELLQFLGISCGSVAELETQLAIAIRPGYMAEGAPAVGQIVRVGKLIRNLRNSLRRKISR